MNQMKIYDEFFGRSDDMFDQIRKEFFGNRRSDFMSGFDSMFSRNFGESLFEDFEGREREFGRGMGMGMGMGGGNFVSKSYTSKTMLGRDGRPITIKHVTNKTSTIDKNGQKIQHKTEMYQNSNEGVKRMVKERTLGDKKIKVVKEKKNGEKNIYRDIENIEDHELEDFHREWDHKAKVHKLPKVFDMPINKKKLESKAIKFQ